MAKFTSKNIEFKDWQKAIFGSNDESNIHWNPDNAELTISTVVSGIDPTDPGHLITRRYMEDYVTTVSGNIDHGELEGLLDDDHPQYLNNTRGDIRYYTKTQSDDRYYTQDQIDTISGSGVEIIVRDEGTAVPNTPHQILNFAGAGVTATDNGSGEVNITIPGSSGVTIQDESSNITGTPHHTINFTGGPVSAYDLGSGVAGVWIQDPIFGSWYAWDGDEGETNTNSASPLEKASLSVTGVPAAYYRIGWYYEWRRNTTSNDYRAEIVIDGTTTIMEHSEESQDVNSWHTQSGYYIANLSSGNHTIRFYHYGEGTSNTSYTRRVRLEIWRVA